MAMEMSHPSRWPHRAASSHHGYSWFLSPSTEHLAPKPAMETLTKLAERRTENKAPQLRRGENATLPSTACEGAPCHMLGTEQSPREEGFGATRLFSIAPRVPASLIRYK